MKEQLLEHAPKETGETQGMKSYGERRRGYRATRETFHTRLALAKMTGKVRRGVSWTDGIGDAALASGVSLLLVFFLLAVHVADAGSRTVVLKYSDLGPPSMAWETIGMDWWQWDNHGDSDPRSRCDIKVVVYRDIPLERVKLMFPVRKEKNQDFRYLEYSQALEYLDKGIKETQDEELSILKSLAERLRETRKRILEALGGPQEDNRRKPNRK